MAGRTLQAIKDGKEGLAIGSIVGGVIGFLAKDSVNIDLFSQSQGILDTIAAVEPTTKMWMTMALIGAAIGFFIDLNMNEIRKVFK